MNATPENFKPGERWLVWRQSYQTLREPPLEMTCIEWAQSGKFIKVMHGISKGVEWLKDRPFLGERLPDVESGNNQTGQASGVEATGGVVAYSHGKLILSLPPAFCEEIEALLENWRKEQFAKIEPGRTFSVIPPEA